MQRRLIILTLQLMWIIPFPLSAGRQLDVTPISEQLRVIKELTQ